MLVGCFRACTSAQLDGTGLRANWCNCPSRVKSLDRRRPTEWQLVSLVSCSSLRSPLFSLHLSSSSLRLARSRTTTAQRRLRCRLQLHTTVSPQATTIGRSKPASSISLALINTAANRRSRPEVRSTHAQLISSALS